MEYLALIAAMDDADPGCRGDDTFIADDLEPDELALMAAICSDCPLLALCRDYCAAASPDAGYWAGTNYNRREGKPRRRR